MTRRLIARRPFAINRAHVGARGRRKWFRRSLLDHQPRLRCKFALTSRQREQSRRSPQMLSPNVIILSHNRRVRDISDPESPPFAPILIVDNQARDRKPPLVLEAIDDWLRSRRAERHPNSAIFVYDIKSSD